MNSQLGGQPILILPEGTLRQTGKDAQSRNIAAAKAVAESIRTTLGPKGMDKMLVDTIGDVTITNDGATILNEMEIEHPAAKMIVEVAKTQEDLVGDGTTTAVIIAGELLKKAESLIEQNIHPTMIIRGFRDANKKALEILNEIAEKITAEDYQILEKIAMTAMTGKSGESARSGIAKLAVEAVRTVAEKEGNKVFVNKDNIKIEKRQGGSIDDSELIRGVVIDKEIIHSNMPKKVRSAKIALLDCALEVKETETNAEIRITAPDQLQSFLEQESRMLKDMVKRVVASGCNMVFCQKGVDDLAQHYLAKEKIAVARRVKKSDIEMLAKATGANIVSSVDELSKDDLGFAGFVEEQKIAGEEMIFVRECKNPKAVSILIRGGTEHVVDEAKRAADDAVLGVSAAVEDGKVVIGGGAIETQLAKKLREYAESVGGREQLAINAFSEAIEIVPRTLAESTGKDSIDILIDLRTQHEKGNVNYGIDVIVGKIADMKALGVVEPLRIKTQAIKSASDVSEMILRIDDVITSKAPSTLPMPPGPPGGMPEY
jgi:thermosome